MVNPCGIFLSLGDGTDWMVMSTILPIRVRFVTKLARKFMLGVNIARTNEMETSDLDNFFHYI